MKQLALSNPEQPSGTLLAALEAKPDVAIQNDLLELADLLSEFSRLGETERLTCLKILSAFGEYARTQRRSVHGAHHR